MKKSQGIAVALLIIVACAAAGWFWARPAYRQYRERRAVVQAKEFLAKGDFRNVYLSARQALQLNPSNVEACALLADLADRARSPAALDWRRRIAELAPTLENKLRVAATALRVQPPPCPLAAEILEELREPAKTRADYHVLRAELALRRKNPLEAAAQFEAAGRLEPTNQLHRLNLAVLNLLSTNVALAQSARDTLESFATNNELRLVALRWLAGDSLQHKQFAAAETYSKRILADPHAGFEDRLQHLGILRLETNSQFEPFLQATEAQASTNAATVYALTSWMLTHSMTHQALAWITNCPDAIKAQQPTPLAIADCYMATGNWESLDSYLDGQKWGDSEFLRLAYLSQAAAKQQQARAADLRWRLAVREAGERLGALTGLLTLAGSWERPDACTDLLWQIAERFPRERWAPRELERLYAAAGDTRNLSKVYGLLVKHDPKNAAAKNNLAATLLLLKNDVPRACEMAKEIYTQHTNEPIIASTYAYSLHLQHRTAEGLAVLAKFKPAVLELPPVALYYGYLLAANGNSNTAAHFLSIAKNGTLLPEEKALFTEAGVSPP